MLRIAQQVRISDLNINYVILSAIQHLFQVLQQSLPHFLPFLPDKILIQLFLMFLTIPALSAFTDNFKETRRAT